MMVDENSNLEQDYNILFDDVIEDVLASSVASNVHIEAGEVKNFLPVITEIVSKDEYVSKIVGDLPDNILNIENQIATIEDEESEMDSYELARELKTEHRKEKKYLFNLLKNLFQKVIQALIVIKSQDQKKEQELFSWQSYVKNRDLSIKQGQQYDISFFPKDVGLGISIDNDKENLLDINLTKNEINLLVEIQKLRQVQKELTQKTINKGVEDFSINTPSNNLWRKSVANEHASPWAGNKHNAGQQQNLWTNWKETGRKQEGDKVTISLQSEYNAQGMHKSTPSLPSF